MPRVVITEEAGGSSEKPILTAVSLVVLVVLVVLEVL